MLFSSLSTSFVISSRLLLSRRVGEIWLMTLRKTCPRIHKSSGFCSEILPRIYCLDTWHDPSLRNIFLFLKTHFSSFFFISTEMSCLCRHTSPYIRAHLLIYLLLWENLKRKSKDFSDIGTRLWHIISSSSFSAELPLYIKIWHITCDWHKSMHWTWVLRATRTVLSGSSLRFLFFSLFTIEVLCVFFAYICIWYIYFSLIRGRRIGATQPVVLMLGRFV